MSAEEIVNRLLEDDYGPPAPDKYLDAVGSSMQLRDVQRQAAAKLDEIAPALQLERQMKKHGVTRDQVKSYLRAESEYANDYRLFPRGRRGSLPPNAIVGMELNDGRKIMFDMAVIPAR